METIELRPLLTYLKIRGDRFEKFTHVIVDEAQDLRPMEWAILRLLNGGSWTLLGDLNQRRTMYSDSSWRQIAERIKCQLPVVELKQGYRSTPAITNYAAHLLEKRVDGRSTSVLGKGEPPKVIDARAQGRTAEQVALTEVTHLKLNLPVKATIAVITTDVRELQRAATQAGWERVGIRAGVDRYEKSTDDGVATVHLLTPDRARGLGVRRGGGSGTGTFHPHWSWNQDDGPVQDVVHVAHAREPLPVGQAPTGPSGSTAQSLSTAYPSAS